MESAKQYRSLAGDSLYGGPYKRFNYHVSLLVARMTREELEQAIEDTKREIYQVKEQLDQTNDPRGEKKLLARLKELQYLQLWYIDLLELIDSGP